MSDIRIYVASLSDYNAGHLLGEWIDATLHVADIEYLIEHMLQSSKYPPAEEWAIHDTEGFLGLGISQYDDITDVAAWAQFIKEHGKLGAEVLEHSGKDMDQAEKMMNEDFCGVFDSFEDYVEETFRDIHKIPDELEYYIDWQRMAQDWELNGYYITFDLGYNEIAIFHNY